MANLSNFLCKDSKAYKELEKDLSSIQKDIIALRKLSRKIQKQQDVLIDEYASTKMIGKCYKFHKNDYIKYIHILGCEDIDGDLHIVYERKYQGCINKIDTFKTSTKLLKIMFINVDEITYDEYNNILIPNKNE